MDKFLKEIAKMGYDLSIRIVNNEERTNILVCPDKNEPATYGESYMGYKFIWKNIPNEKLAKKIMKYEEDYKNKIEEKIEKQKWRPAISTSRYDHYALSWWSLGEPDYRSDRKEYCRYIKNWVGLSVSEISKADFIIISQFLKKFKKTEVFHIAYEEDGFDEITISDFFNTIKPADWFRSGITSMAIWFKDLDTHNQFVSLLDGIVERTVVIELGEKADFDAIKKTLKNDDNYIYVKDRGKSYISMIDDGTKPVIVKMFSG